MENYLSRSAKTSVSLPADFKKLRDLVSGEELSARPTAGNGGWRRGNGEPLVSFDLELLPHSYRVFAAEK